MASLTVLSIESRKRHPSIAFAIVADAWTLEGHSNTLEGHSHKMISTDSSLFNAVSLEVRVRNFIL